MARQRITDPRHRLLGYVEESHAERKVVVLDALQRRLGWFSPETNLTVAADGRVVGFGNKLLRLLPAEGGIMRIEPESE
jgi:hypothetical protein